MKVFRQLVVGALKRIERVEKWLPKHPLPMKAVFRNCFLINYSMKAATLQAVLPPGLTPDLYKNKAFVSIVVADLEGMRPGFLPPSLGFDYKQIVYRCHVLAPNGERGVHFIRSYSTSAPMSLAGSLFSIFHFNMCDFLWQGADKHLPLRVHTPQHADGSKQQVFFALEPWDSIPAGDSEAASAGRGRRVRGEADAASLRACFDLGTATKRMPASSVFAGQSVDDNARAFLVEMYTGLSALPGRDSWVAVKLLRADWDIVSVSHDPSAGSPVHQFMQGSAHFPPGSCCFDSALYVHDLAYHWLPGEIHQRSVADVAARCRAVAASPFHEYPPPLPQETDLLAPECTTVFYNGAHHASAALIRRLHWLAGRSSDPTVIFVDISPSTLSSERVPLLSAAFSVSATEARVRLHVVDTDGALHTGVKGVAAVLVELPGLGWVGTLLFKVPGLLPLLGALVEQGEKPE